MAAIATLGEVGRDVREGVQVCACDIRWIVGPRQHLDVQPQRTFRLRDQVREAHARGCSHGADGLGQLEQPVQCRSTEPTSGALGCPRTS